MKKLLLTTATVCISIMVFGTYPVSARDLQYEILPDVDGVIYDTYPYDGIGDYIVDDGIIMSPSSGYYDQRAVMEFDVGSINLKKIKSAWLQLVKVGQAVPPDVYVFPIEVFGYQGDGVVDFDDSHPGWFIKLFDGYQLSSYQPYLIDVTEFCQIAEEFNWPILGFKLRTNLDVGQVNFATLEFTDWSPMLILKMEDKPDTND